MSKSKLCKSIFLMAIGTVWLVLAGKSVEAQKATALSKPIVVAINDNFPPYSFRAASGEIQGIIPDQWQEWSRITGRKVEFRPLKLSKALAEMASAESDIDVIDGIIKTPEREKFLDYLDSYDNIQASVFYHKSLSGIKKIENLKGFTVAATTGETSARLLEKDGIDIQYYPDYQSIIRAADNADIRLFCMNEPSAFYYLNKFSMVSSYKNSLPIMKTLQYRAVRKIRQPLADGSDLYTVLQKGFHAILPETYQKISSIWISPPVDRRLEYTIAILLAITICFALILGLFALTLKKQVNIRTKALAESEQRNQLFIQALPDLFLVVDQNCYTFECSTTNPNLLFRPAEEQVGKTMKDAHFPSAVVELFDEAVHKALETSAVVMCEYQLEVASGVNLWFEARLVKMAENRVLCIIRDATERKKAEQNMAKALKEKETLLKEVYHRVKNNLQVVSSLVQLQMSTLKNEEDVRGFEETQLRIKTMIQLHELLYRSEGLNSINMADYIPDIIELLQTAYLAVAGSFTLDVMVEPLDLPINVAIPVGLIVNEALSNSFKYAAQKTGEKTITVRFINRPGGKKHLLLADNGPGLPSDWEKKSQATLGLTLIRVLAEQIKADITISGENGTVIELILQNQSDLNLLP